MNRATAHDAATPPRGVDLRVRFMCPATSAQFFGVQFYLEDVPGCPVDRVTETALRPCVWKDAVHV